MQNQMVDQNETLYRQIKPGGNPIFYNQGREPPVFWTVFLPTDDDTDGLSFIQSSLRTQIWAAFRPQQPKVQFLLAKIVLDDIKRKAINLGFSTLDCRTTPDALDINHGFPCAHCIVVNINRKDYDSNSTLKAKIKELARAISNAITNNDVVGPFLAPTANDPYRP